jgi:hypothetical protein
LFDSIEFAVGDGVFFLLGAEVGGEQVAGGIGQSCQDKSFLKSF